MYVMFYNCIAKLVINNKTWKIVHANYGNNREKRVSERVSERFCDC